MSYFLKVIKFGVKWKKNHMEENNLYEDQRFKIHETILIFYATVENISCNNRCISFGI